MRLNWGAKLYLVCLAGTKATEATYPLIAGYAPGSSVVDHNNLDLDQSAMEAQLTSDAGFDYTAATAIYTSGGNSKAYAEFSVPSLSAEVAKGAPITCTATNGDTISATVYATAAAGATTVTLKYAVGTCNVGGLPSDLQETSGCCTVSALVVTGVGSITPSAVVNKAGRTLKGFSTGAKSKMKKGLLPETACQSV